MLLFSPKDSAIPD